MCLASPCHLIQVDCPTSKHHLTSSSLYKSMHRYPIITSTYRFPHPSIKAGLTKKNNISNPLCFTKLPRPTSSTKRLVAHPVPSHPLPIPQSAALSSRNIPPDSNSAWLTKSTCVTKHVRAQPPAATAANAACWVYRKRQLHKACMHSSSRSWYRHVS
jgi:hypothetical protein